MEFLTLLIVLGLVQYWGSGSPLQKDKWFYTYVQWVGQSLPKSYARLIVMVGLPLIVIGLLQLLVYGQLFGLLSLVLYVCLLVFSLGRGDFGTSVQNYLTSWSHGNFESAYERASEIGDFKQGEAIVDHVSLHEHVRSAVLYEGYERWFAVIFWFCLLGPIGAVAYRLSYLTARLESIKSEDRNIAIRFVHYLDWMPARLLALSFALTGNFNNGFSPLKKSCFDNLPIVELLDSCAVGALESGGENKAYPTDPEHFIEYGKQQITDVELLLSRSVFVWLALIAIVTVIAD